MWDQHILQTVFESFWSVFSDNRDMRTDLTGGAENLKSEDPLKARNLGVYIRSWTESSSFSSTQPM